MPDTTGRDIAAARDRWFDSPEGRRCLGDDPPPTGRHLRNRLELAFLAGVTAGREIGRTEAMQAVHKPANPLPVPDPTIV